MQLRLAQEVAAADALLRSGGAAAKVEKFDSATMAGFGGRRASAIATAASRAAAAAAAEAVAAITSANAAGATASNNFVEKSHLCEASSNTTAVDMDAQPGLSSTPRKPRLSVTGMLTFGPGGRDPLAPAFVPPAELSDEQLARLAARNVGVADILATWPGRRTRIG